MIMNIRRHSFIFVFRISFFWLTAGNSVYCIPCGNATSVFLSESCDNVHEIPSFHQFHKPKNLFLNDHFKVGYNPVIFQVNTHVIALPSCLCSGQRSNVRQQSQDNFLGATCAEVTSHSKTPRGGRLIDTLCFEQTLVCCTIQLCSHVHCFSKICDHQLYIWPPEPPI